MLVITDNYSFSYIWWFNSSNTRNCSCSIYLYDFFEVTTILGISAFYHDSAAAIIKDGEIVAAAQEERFTRKKHDPSYPKNAIKFVLNYSKNKVK